MVEYTINGNKIELDISKPHLDFYWTKEQGRVEGRVVQINLEGMLEAIQSGQVAVDGNLREYLCYLRRWKTDAPRKRMLREMRRSGMAVLTTDALFEEEGGEQTVNGLENTGVFAAHFLQEVYGEEK